MPQILPYYYLNIISFTYLSIVLTFLVINFIILPYLISLKQSRSVLSN